MTTGVDLSEVLDAYGQPLEAPYNVPGHLEEDETVGPFPKRTVLVTVAAFATSMTLVANNKALQASGMPTGDPVVNLAEKIAPFVLLAPFAAWWLQPPAEHGLANFARHLPRPQLLDPDRLSSYQKMRIQDGVIHTGVGDECLTIWRLPTVNLDVASTVAKRTHRGQWGTFLDALGFRVTVLIRAQKIERLSAVAEMYEHGSQEAKELAHWLRSHMTDRQMIARDRFLAIPAPDPDTLKAYCDDVRESMAQFEWWPGEPANDHELETWFNNFFPRRPESARLGPSMVSRKAHDCMVDGEYTRTYELGFPSTILTNWWQPFVDGDLPLDLALDIEPMDVGAVKRHLDRRQTGLETSRLNPARQVALEQVRGLRMAVETNRVKPFRVGMTVMLRASTRSELKRLDARLKQRVRDRGRAALRELTWEQFEGFERVVPLGKSALPNRSRRLETGTLARTTPLASRTFVLPNGVPLGEAGSMPVLYTTLAGQKNRHMGVYGISGAGKGFFVKVYEVREHFQHDVSVWGIDGDPQHEYSGRFCQYLHGVAPVVKSVKDVDREPIDRYSRVVIWDLSQCPDRLYGQCVTRILERFTQYVSTYSALADFIFDEAVNVLQFKDAADALTELVQFGRHNDVGVRLITQLVSDFFGNDLGRRAHRLAESYITFAQNPAELDDAAGVLRLTAAEKNKLEKGSIGQGLLVTLAGTRRCWVDLYNKVSPAEMAMAHTTPRTALTQRRRVRYLDKYLTNGHERVQPAASEFLVEAETPAPPQER